VENCDENSELLTTKGHNLPPIEKQRQYVLRCLVQKNACPNCGHALNFFEGARVDIDDWEDKLGAPFCECNVCKRELIYVVPFLATAGNGGWHWQLVPMDPKR
jgi:hypothetical protein